MKEQIFIFKPYIGEICEITAEPIQLEEYGKFYVHKANGDPQEKSWCVTDPYTGLGASLYAKTKKDAIRNAKERLDNRCKNKDGYLNLVRRLQTEYRELYFGATP